MEPAEKKAHSAPVDEPGSDVKKNPRAAHTRRLAALMEIFGFGQWGDQKRFAEYIGAEQNQFNNIKNGHPLSIEVAHAIVRRFPDVSLDFLYYGRAKNSNRLNLKLREWERQTGKQVFKARSR